jgi:hypothetical protein
MVDEQRVFVKTAGSRISSTKRIEDPRQGSLTGTSQSSEHKFSFTFKRDALIQM